MTTKPDLHDAALEQFLIACVALVGVILVIVQRFTAVYLPTR